MSLIEIIKKRRSIRKFKSDPIEKEKIDQLIEALIWAPSARNLQSRKFYFVKSKEMIAKLTQETNRNFDPLPPLFIVCCLNKNLKEAFGDRGENLYAIMDVSASIENLLLTATELGLATLWMGSFDEEVVKKALEIPDNLRPVSIVPVGYSDDQPPAPPRVDKEEAIQHI